MYVQVAPFDAKSVEMFRLMSDKAGRTAHFYPLSMATAAVCPPPEAVTCLLSHSSYLLTNLLKLPPHYLITTSLLTTQRTFLATTYYVPTMYLPCTAYHVP